MKFLLVVATIVLIWIYGSQLIETYIPLPSSFSTWIKVGATIGILAGYAEMATQDRRDKTQDDILEELKKANELRTKNGSDEV